ncbi:hypothetical protein [Flavobacterium cyanobacteriorum]|uniref:hypothetical protein n=1 Tax=Flavobacterium cyanobacteriorum TaxID=2022802 RepID=UPI0013FE1C99|nr:hypothetical protein [Flavobacterium cyanobacteriorum]
MAQEKETIIILFDKERDIKSTDGCKTNFKLAFRDSTEINFQHILSFNYNCKKLDKKKIKIKDITVISAETALDKVRQYLDIKAKQCEDELKEKDKTPCQLIRHPPGYNYNNYFAKIYIFEKLTDNKGVLYEVTWDWFLVD